MFEEWTLFQQAYVVRDLDAGIARWTALGAGPFAIAAHHRCDRFEYRGTDAEADVSYAFGYLGDTMLQLIEQHDDTASIYRDLFGPGEEGYHHQGFLVHDVDRACDRLVGLGYEVACRLHADGVDAAYVDTRALNGGFTEVHGDPPHILGIFETWRRRHRRHGQRAAVRTD